MLSTVLMCLALNVYHEARNEPLVGQYAVAHVVLNRVASDRYPDDVCSVVHQGYTVGRRDCQFSWYCDGKSDKPRNQKAWAEAQLVARDVLEETVDDFTNGALFYHATYVQPYWAASFTKTVAVGTHIFYSY